MPFSFLVVPMNGNGPIDPVRLWLLARTAAVNSMCLVRFRDCVREGEREGRCGSCDE